MIVFSLRLTKRPTILAYAEETASPSPTKSNANRAVLQVPRRA
jgi:hypothetical protein